MKMPDKQNNEPSTSSLSQVKKDKNPSKELKNEGQGPSTVVIQRIFDQSKDANQSEVAQNENLDENNNPIIQSTSVIAEVNLPLRVAVSITSVESQPLQRRTVKPSLPKYHWKNIIGDRIYLRGINRFNKEHAKRVYNAWWDPTVQCWHVFKSYSPYGKYYSPEKIDGAIAKYGISMVHNEFDLSGYESDDDSD